MVEVDDGWYTCGDFADRLFMNDKMKSIRVPRGYHVILGEHCEFKNPWFKTISAVDAAIEITDLTTIGFPLNAASSMLV
jgi:hypothetical protein